MVRLFRPFRAPIFVATCDPGRCPGLSYDAPLGLLAETDLSTVFCVRTLGPNQALLTALDLGLIVDLTKAYLPLTTPSRLFFPGCACLRSLTPFRV